MAQDEALAESVERFCQQIRPIEELCYLEHQFNDKAIELARAHDLFGMLIPKELGGRGASFDSYIRAITRIGREGTGVRTLFSGHIAIGQVPILTFGSPEQKRRYLPASCRGECLLCFGLTEPEAGSNPLQMETTYRREKDRFVLNGVKYLISNGGIAHAMVAFAYPEGKQGRISAFIVDLKGETVEREDLVAKIGLPTSNTAMVSFSEHPVPLENMLGEEGNGFRIAMTTLLSGRLSVAAGCLGVIEDLLADTMEYAKQREQHGKAIARHQLVQDHLAQIEIHRQSSQAMLDVAVAAKMAAERVPADRALASRADLASASAKYFISNAAWDAADRAVQVFGGRGYSDLYRPGRHLKDVRVCRIYEGTDEILKLKIAAGILGKEFEAFH